MTKPELGANADTWTAFMTTHAPTGQPIAARDGPAPFHFCPAPNLEVDKACPRCSRTSHWALFQVVGETPGIPEMPAQGSGLVYRCGLCGFTRRYRERPATDAERAERQYKLLKGAKP